MEPCTGTLAFENESRKLLFVSWKKDSFKSPLKSRTCRGGNVLVLDLGKLKIESDLQPKNLSLDECTMSEIQLRLYDKFNISVTEVKVLLADSGEHNERTWSMFLTWGSTHKE